ncbi:MAG: glycoside hydrolase family 3 C-terminal domain-containing protein [Roseburia sp.]|nr:glycoside hydrolase family 3 C-terminal domain-containing protein [Anaeroplasma bactoclasticum]MCM1195756.1 glycoside hydrolase family 3 C-terminal domain-containing protein [Roseburia sp.]MCM1556981.1 glycoside hydrolase family 3 C-terminal domain-containing protein [Anaeroplasma bactoclasticum]
MNSNDLKKLMDSLSLEQKAKLLVGIDFWHTSCLPNEREVCMTDGPNGLRMQENGGKEVGLKKAIPATCFPSSSCLACSFDENLMYVVGQAIAEECINEQVDILLGPAANIKRSPLCGRNFEYYSEDPYLSGILSSGFIQGVQSLNVKACLKHFACNNQEYGRMINDSIVDEKALFEIYLKPFEIAIKRAQPKAIMCSYNKLNGIFASQNQFLLDSVLRKKYGFTGTIISDWGAVSNRIEALKAGLDLEMPASLSYIDVIDAIKSNTLSLEVLNKRVENVLKLYQDRPDFKKKFISSHHELARKAASESFVLLKNNDQILPLHKHEKIGIFGNYDMRIQGAGSSKVSPIEVDSFIHTITNYTSSYVYFEKMTEEISTCDKLLCFVGLSSKSEIEGKDRSNLKLEKNDIELVLRLTRLHKNVIVILTTGSVVELPFIDQISGLILTYLGGEAAAKALCDILYNKVNPSGHLAETWIKQLSDFGVSDYGKSINQSIYKESLFVGYRYYDKVNIEPLFPFGYGLSYTTFLYSNLKIEATKAYVTIKNTGPYRGKEVVQLYVRDANPMLIRPVRQLKAFQKLELSPLEEKTIEFEISDDFFEFYSLKSKEFMISGGTYYIEIGNSSRNIVLTEKYILSQEKIQEEYPSYLQFKEYNQITLDDFRDLYGSSYPTDPPQYPFTLDSPMIDVQTKWIGKLFVYFGLKVLKKRSKTEEEYEMNKYTFLTGPIRMIGMGVKKTNHQLEGIVDILNGKILRGAIRFLKKDKRMKKLKQ